MLGETHDDNIFHGLGVGEAPQPLSIKQVDTLAFPGRNPTLTKRAPKGVMAQNKVAKTLGGVVHLIDAEDKAVQEPMEIEFEFTERATSCFKLNDDEYDVEQPRGRIPHSS